MVAVSAGLFVNMSFGVHFLPPPFESMDMMAEPFLLFLLVYASVCRSREGVTGPPDPQPNKDRWAGRLYKKTDKWAAGSMDQQTSRHGFSEINLESTIVIHAAWL